MNHHEILSAAGGLLALVMFIPMFRQVLREHGAGQSFASWFLWGSLDGLLIVSLNAQGGNFWIVVGFALGDLLIAATLAWQRRFNWAWFETLILILVIVCVIGWKLAGPRTATIFSIVAVCIAGIPGFLSLKRTPDRRTASVWLGYSVANLLAFLGGTAMTLEQRLAPGVFMLASLLMVMAGWKGKSARRA
jgi:hypothetical protein